MKNEVLISVMSHGKKYVMKFALIESRMDINAETKTVPSMILMAIAILAVKKMPFEQKKKNVISALNENITTGFAMIKMQSFPKMTIKNKRHQKYRPEMSASLTSLSLILINH